MKILEMPAAASLGSSDELTIVQGGENKKLTGSLLKSFTSDGMQSALSLGALANVDLDDYKENGFYWVSQTGVTNKPVSNFGYLEVIKPSTTIQIFTCFGSNSTVTRGDTYVRFFANNQWYDWVKIASSIPEPVKITRTNLTQGSGISKWSFSGAAAKTGYERMIISANPSSSSATFVRSEANGDNMDIYINNTSGSSLTFNMTIVVGYFRS